MRLLSPVFLPAKRFHSFYDGQNYIEAVATYEIWKLPSSREHSGRMIGFLWGSRANPSHGIPGTESGSICDLCTGSTMPMGRILGYHRGRL